MSPAAALIIDLILNLIIAVSSAAVIISYFLSDADVGGEPERKVTLRYFTTDSNILACLAAAVMSVCDAVALASPGTGIPYFARILKYAGTVAVAVTICTVILFLLPSALAAGNTREAKALFAGKAFVVHLSTPVLSILSFVLFENAKGFTFAESLWTMLPAVIYSVVYLIMVVFVKRWPDFYGFTFGGKMYMIPVSVIGIYLLSLGAATLMRCVPPIPLTVQ